jgi:hypothetical protein
MPDISPKHQAARQAAIDGLYPFPCQVNGKRPACPNGFRDGTNDLEQIDRWWSEADYNIGVSPGACGCTVLDVDPPRGVETLATCELEHGLLPRTRTFKTPRGGSHYWFRGKCKSTVGTLGPNLDTRSYGGYVLLPPSTTPDGTYTLEDDTEIADVPGWISNAVNREHEHTSAAPDIDLDLPANLARADALVRQYVAVGDVAVGGNGGNDRTYRLACEVLGLGLQPATAYDYIRRSWNPACIPPWDDEDLAGIVRHAAEYMQNDMGAFAVKPGTEIFAEFADRQPAESGRKSRYYPYELGDTEAFEPPDWLIPDLIPKRGTVQITGKQKSFKTFLTLDMVLGIAGGVSTFGYTPAVSPVVYIAGENASALVLKHVPAWCMANDQEPALLPFRVVREMPHAAQPDEMLEFVQQIKDTNIRPGVVVIDTATRALRGLDENSAKDMGQFSAACEMIQRELDCTVIVIRHTGKDDKRGGRGSNVIEGDFDTILEVRRHEDDERKTMFCTLAVKEQRNAAEREEPFAFEMVPLGQSLVARPIPTSDYTRATRPQDPFPSSRIGAALAKLEADSEDRGITTHVLAVELTPQVQGETDEQRGAAIKHTERMLRQRAKSSLAGYVAGEGTGLRWFIESTQP